MWLVPAALALIVFTNDASAIDNASPWSQDQNSGNSTSQSQTNQSSPGQDQPNQAQPNQDRPNHDRTNQSQTNQAGQNQPADNPAGQSPSGQDQSQGQPQPGQQQPGQSPPQPPVQAPENPQPQPTSPNQTTEKQGEEKPEAGKPEAEKPDSDKNDNGNPAAAAAQATKQVAIEAADVTKKLGEQTLAKVRDWEIGWATGPYVGRQREMVPMTSSQRRRIYLDQTFLEPSDYFKRMFSAAIDQARGTPYQWGGGFGGYGKRFASREGQFIIANSLAAFGNAKLKYEPRYGQCRCTTFLPRLRHAIVRNFVTYNQTERELRPQWALYGGAFSGGVISTAWKPHPRNALTNGGYAVLGQAGYGSALNVFIEFAGEINRKLWTRKHK
jgi:hypothetical protein